MVLPMPSHILLPSMTVAVDIKVVMSMYRILKTIIDTEQVWDADSEQFLDLHDGELRGVKELFAISTETVKTYTALLNAGNKQ